MYFWIEEAPAVEPRGEIVTILTRSGRPLFNMPRSVALMTARRLLAAVADMDDREEEAPIPFPSRR